MRRAALVVGLGNYTHPSTRHSIGQFCLAPLLTLAEAHDRRMRDEVARRAARLPPEAPVHALPPPKPMEPFQKVREAKGWLARVSVLLDTLPPKGAAARRAPTFQARQYPYALYDFVFYIPRMLMNVNGAGVAAVRALYPDIGLQDTILLHDELQRAFGKVSYKAGGSAAGHNGVRSVQSVLKCGGASLQQPDIARIRIGIDRPDDPAQVSSYVLGEMPPAWLEACRMHPDGTPGPVLAQVWHTLVHAWCLPQALSA